jgi:hypothetical protein
VLLILARKVVLRIRARQNSAEDTAHPTGNRRILITRYCNTNGVRHRDVKELPHLRKERTTTNGIKGCSGWRMIAVE